jgi:hypothetical protein
MRSGGGSLRQILDEALRRPGPSRPSSSFCFRRRAAELDRPIRPRESAGLEREELAHRRSTGCPSAPAMQHSGAADRAGQLHR